MSYMIAMQKMEANYASSLHSKAITPFSTVNGLFGFIILIAWLIASPSLSRSLFSYGRWPIFYVIAHFSAWNLLYCRSIGVVGSIGVGLNSVLCVTFAINFMFLRDPRTFKKLSVRTLAHVRRHDSTVCHFNEDSGLLHLCWDHSPDSIWRRIFWTLDLLTSVRGVQWSTDMSPSPKSYPTYGSLFSGRVASLPRNILRFIFDYFLIDLIKCLMIADPYFLGFPSHPPPPHITVHFTSPLALYTYHMILAAAGTFVAIDLIFAFSVLVQVNILGPSIIGLNASSGMFPPLWGSPRAILNKGLRGFWGETWHQMLRMHFGSIGDAIAKCLLQVSADTSIPKENERRAKHSNFLGTNTAIRITTSFLLSGILHACASYTLLGPSNPWASFFFFALQPLGIVIQMALSHIWSIYYGFRLPASLNRILRQSFNLGFTVFWLWMCCGLLADDMSIGGVWLFEPVPVSLFRGLGYSKEDYRFWCW